MIAIKRFVYGLVLTGCALLAAGAAVPPPEKLLPSDTLIVLTVPDYAKVTNSAGRMPFNLLLQDPAMKPFKDKFMAKLTSDVIAPLEKEFGIKLSDYAGMAQGQITFALTKNGWEGQPKQKPGFLFLLDTKGKSDALKTNLAALKKKWVDAGRQLRTDKIRDLDFTTIIFSSDEITKTLDKVFPDPDKDKKKSSEDEEDKPKKAPEKLEWTIGQSDSLLVLGNSVPEIEKLLIRQSGGSAPSLSEHASFASSYNSLFRDALSYGWVDLKGFMNIVMKTVPKGGEGAPATSFSPDKILKALGLTGLDSFSLNFLNSDDGALFNFVLKAPGDRQGLLKLLAFENKDANPPSFVPAEAVKFTRWRLDLQKSFATIESTIAQIEPQYAGLLKTMIDLAGKDKDPNFDLRQQLIANLGDDIISYEKAPRQMTLEDMESPPSLFLVNSPKPEQLAGALKAVVSFLPPAMAAPKLKEREFLGRKVYTLNMPSTTPDGKRKDRSLSYSASGGYLAISMDAAMLEEYLRGNSGKALTETPGLSEAAQKVGGMSTGLFGYENQRDTTRAALEILKKESGSLADLFSGSAVAGRLKMNNNNTFKEWVDFSLLPSFDQIAKYFYINVWSGTLNAEGATFKLYTPTPPQLKGK